MTVSAAVALRAQSPDEEVPSDRHRETLARRFADLLFLPGDRASPFEKGLVDDILSRLYVSLDHATRLRLARRLANLSDPPHRLTRLMASDRPEIARLFLERVELFDEAELVALIATTTPQHHAMIARRASVPRAVTEALIATEAPEIIETILLNRGALMSPAVYAALAGMSRGSTSYQELLLARPDLPASLAHEMFWWVGPALRRAILQRYSMERRLFVEAVADLDLVEADAPADVDWAFRLSGVVRPQMKALGGDLVALTQWLENPAEGRLGEALADALAIDRATAGRAVLDPGGEPLAVLLKALGLSPSQFRSLETRIRPRLADPCDERFEQLAALFEQLSTDWADLVLRLWDQQRVG